MSDAARAHLARILDAWDAYSVTSVDGYGRDLRRVLVEAIESAREWVGTEQKIGKPPSSGPPYNSQGIPM